MNNLLIAIAVFIITVVGALFAVPHFIDWNSYRSVFEDEARRVIGRTVEVDGDVKLHLLPAPYFRVEQVRIADTTLPQGFFRAESLSLKLSITPLLRGTVEATEIELQRPLLRLVLDAKGRWNWQSFARTLSKTGYMPDNVALTSLRIVDGTLALHATDGGERARLEGVNGTLSAPALRGPYVFRGSYALNGVERHVGVATGLPEAGGQIPFRVSLRGPGNAESYLLEAHATDLMGRLRVDGKLTARLPIPAPPSLSRRSAADAAAETGATSLAVKATVAADVAGATLADLTLTFEHGDRPQTVAGQARVAWGAPVAIDMGLSSRWLDLDLLAGASEGIGPLASVTRLAAWLKDLLPGQGQTRMHIAVERANLAGAEIGPVRLGLARSGGRLDITELRTALPGGSRGEMRGVASATAKSLVFNGSVGLSGTSTRRFVAWASGGRLSLPPDADGSFDLRAGLTVEPAQATVRDLIGTLAGTRLKGGGRYRWTGRRELAATLEGPALDVRGFIPADTSVVDLLGALAGRASATKDEAPAGNAVLRALRSDLDLRLKAGRLVTADRAYRDFTGAVTMKGGHLRRLELRLNGDGYRLELEGRVNNLAAAPKGALRGLVVAESADTIAPLAKLLGVPEAFHPGDSRRQALAPLRLAGTVTFGARAATSADWAIDGEGNGAAIKVDARFDGGTGGWREGHAELTASVEARDGAQMAGLLFPEGVPAARTEGATEGAGRGRVVVRASGVPAQGLASLVSVEGAGLALRFRGQLRPTDAGVAAKGDLEARAGDGTVLATLVGLAPALRLDGIPVSARGRLSLDAGSIGMGQLTLQLGRHRLSGRIALSPAGDRHRIDASLNADDVSLAMLLGPLLDRRFGAAGAAEAALTGRHNPWPDAPFSAAALDAFEGRIRLNSRRLTLASGLALDRAALDAVIEPGRVDVKEIVGAVPGGQVEASLRIDKAAAGVDVRGSLDFRFALDKIAGAHPAGDGGAEGGAKGNIRFRGRGLSPRAVVSALQGRGKIAFDSASLPGLAPSAVAVAAEAALNGEADKMAATLRESLKARLATAGVPLGQASFPLEVVDGKVRSTSLLIDTPGGRITGTARLDLEALELDSEWRLVARTKGAEGPPLPPVIVAYQAPLAQLGAGQRQIDTSALEQELSARRIERDLKELERLRRAREEAERRRRAEEEAERLRRAKEEAERLRRAKEEAERLRQAAEPGSPAPAASPPPPIVVPLPAPQPPPAALPATPVSPAPG